MRAERTFLEPVLGPVERVVYRSLRVAPGASRAGSLRPLAAGLLGGLDRAALTCCSGPGPAAPLNPDGFGAVGPALGPQPTAVSFVTNTDWQKLPGASRPCHLTQMAGLAVQNFLSAGSAGRGRGPDPRADPTRAETIAHFWADLTRGVVYVLLPCRSWSASC
jgi:K+-transporting ATPase ATPase A chain